MKHALLLTLGLICIACGLFTPGVKSPCDGLYCVSIDVSGVPGTGLICYETEAKMQQARTALRARGVTVR